MNPRTRYPDEMILKTERAFKKEHIQYKLVNLLVGCTDGTSFAKKGVKAISIIGMTTKKFDPTYHTRLDNLTNLDPKALEAMKKVAVRFIQDWDDESS